MFIIDYPILPAATPNGPLRVSPTLAVIEISEAEYIDRYAPKIPTVFGIRLTYETHALTDADGVLTGQYQIAVWQRGGHKLEPFGQVYDSEAKVTVLLHAVLLDAAQENPHASFAYETRDLAEDCLADLLDSEPL
jgi:hypothetical protein